MTYVKSAADIEKKRIRDVVRLRRELVLAANPAAADPLAESVRISEILRTLPFWDTVRSPCIYLALPSEAPTTTILTDCFSRQLTVLAPRVSGDILTLHRITADTPLTHGAFGILEPPAAAPVAFPVADGGVCECDCFLVPGVAFDLLGGRVGHGKGFYDRLLAQIPLSTPRVGLAWEWQIFKEVPVVKHDVRMDWIVTPERAVHCSPGAM
ncbi:MAG: 5-formyltetrahydrofolate cyclo-ligase [Puniceicoccales bacterium]|nr:5-formyltetrahydrofolate cyclo-ligase [Puniceicoccales bacterium]